MPTVTPVLRTAKAGKDGHAPLWIRIADASGNRYLSLGEKVHPRFWNEKKLEVRKSHPHHEELNALIAQKVDEAQRQILRAKLTGRNPSLREVKRKVADGKAASDFFAYAEMSIGRMERKGQADSAKRYRHIIFTKLREHIGRGLRFDEIDLNFLREWETALVEKGNRASTVATAFRAFRSIYNKAEADGLTEGHRNPFAQFRPAPIPRPTKAKLTDSEMRAIETVTLRSGSPAWHARNAFVFSFYCAGMRFKDVCLLRRGDIVLDGDGWRLRYAMSKTDRSMVLRLPPPAVAVANLYGLTTGAPSEYLFPFLQGVNISSPSELRRIKDSRNTSVNKQLKKVAKSAGVNKDVSFHIARHSFADIARVRGMNLHTLSKALGHSSLQVTEHYLASIDQSALDREMIDLFGK